MDDKNVQYSSEERKQELNNELTNLLFLNDSICPD